MQEVRGGRGGVGLRDDVRGENGEECFFMGINSRHKGHCSPRLWMLWGGRVGDGTRGSK